MQLFISHQTGLPIYLQIVNQVKYMVASGRLTAGDELPAIRGLAEQLVINPNTVARAYRELEHAGVVTSRMGSGTYIADNGSPLARRERLRILTEHVDALLAQARHLDFAPEDVIDLLRNRSKEVKEPHGGTKK